MDFGGFLGIYRLSCFGGDSYGFLGMFGDVLGLLLVFEILKLKKNRILKKSQNLCYGCEEANTSFLTIYSNQNFIIRNHGSFQ